MLENECKTAENRVTEKSVIEELLPVLKDEFVATFHVVENTIVMRLPGGPEIKLQVSI